MSASEQETQQISEDWEVGEESQQQEQEIGQQTENEENGTMAEAVHPKQKGMNESIDRTFNRNEAVLSLGLPPVSAWDA